MKVEFIYLNQVPFKNPVGYIKGFEGTLEEFKEITKISVVNGENIKEGYID